MKNAWYLINIIFVMLGVFGGYNSLAPGQLQNKNPDAVLCFLLLLTMPVFCLLSVSYSNRRTGKKDNLIRASFGRNPLNWWGDPLQSLFISTCAMTATALGALLRRPAIGSVGFWMLGSYISIALGLVIGQLLVYRIYRGQVIKSQASARKPATTEV
jgi:hypothetical protein